MSEQKYGRLADQAARKHGVDPRLFRALVTQESGWNPSARSPVGAFGLTQVMPFHKADLSTPASQLDFGAQYLSSQLKKFGSPEKALAAYNAGPGAVQKYGGIPPYKETQNYVKTIMGNVGSSSGLTGGGGGSSSGYTSQGVAPVAGSVDPRLMGQIKTLWAKQQLDVKRGKKPNMKRFAKLMGLARQAKAAQAPSYQAQSRYVEGTGGGHDGHDHGAPLSNARLSGVKGKLMGTPGQGTHTLGNWQSDNAIDLGFPVGTPLYAAFSGQIGSRFGSLGADGGRFNGLRLYVEGDDGNEAFYSHLSKFAPGLKPGTRVKKGQLIGFSGTANGVPHLHLGLKRGDPRALIEG